MPTNPQPLMTAVRFTVILKYLAQLLLLLAALTLVPAGAALLLGETEIAVRYGLVIALLLLIAPLARLPQPKQFQRNEALCVTALTFIITPTLMTYPLMGSDLSFMDAWFEAVSGVTTTGLSTLAEVESRHAIFLFGRAWMQWYGGLGVGVMAVALFMGHRITSKKLLESAGEEGHATTAHTFARQILLVYLILTAVGFVAAYLVHPDPFAALIHVLAAISTGGFSGYDDSLANQDGAFRMVVISLSLAGSVCLPLYYLAYQRGPLKLLQDEELRMLLATLLAAVAALVALLKLTEGMGWPDSLAQGALLGVSAQSTAGFSSLDVATLGAPAKLLLMLAMSCGGSAGSTAGGIKVIRILIMLRLIQLTLRRTASSPRSILLPRLGNSLLEPEDLQNVLVMLGLWSMVVLLSWLPFLIYGYAPLDALFEVISATGTVGLSAGITRTTLEPLLKIVLGLDMLLGRLEVIALLVLLYPRTWIGRRRDLT